MAVPVYYRVLGLDPWATAEDIHDAFHRLAALYETDGTLENALAVRRLRLISEAYAVLGEPTRRAAYDAQLTGVPTRSPAPLTIPEAAPIPSAEEPASQFAPATASPADMSRRPTLWGRFRRRPFRSMGAVVALTFVLLGAWARPQRPSTNLPLGAPPSIVVPPAHTPLVAAVSPRSQSAVVSPSTERGRATVRTQVSPIPTKGSPIATLGSASQPAQIGTATPVPTHSAAHHTVSSATPPSAKGSGTPAISPTPSSQSANSRRQGGSDRAGTPARHVKISAVAMAYDVYPDVSINRSVTCAVPQRQYAPLPLLVNRRPGAVFLLPQGGPQARAILPSPFRNGRPMRLLVRPRVTWAHSPAQGRGPYAGVPHVRPQATAHIVQA